MTLSPPNGFLVGMTVPEGLAAPPWDALSELPVVWEWSVDGQFNTVRCVVLDPDPPVPELVFLRDGR